LRAANGQRHVTYGVKSEHYDTVGAPLLWTLKQGIGADFDAEHEAAWVNVYNLLAKTMISASEQVAVSA
jgi:nitric oxide dioxygenase